MKINKYILINSLGSGGAERQVSLIAKEIGISKIILLNDDIKYAIEVDKYVLSNNKVVSSIVETIKIPIYIFKFIRFIKRFKKPDIVFSFLVRSNLINILTGKILGYKIIISERNTPSKIYVNGLSYYYGYLIKWCYPFADNIIVNSYGIKNDLIKNFNIKSKKINVIYNAIDIENVDILKEEEIENKYKDFFEKNNILINVGSLTEQKGQIYLIKILKYLKKFKTNYKLVIIGVGKLKDNLISHAEDLNLNVHDTSNNEQVVNNNIDILFLNHRANPYKYIKSSNIFLLTSLWEGFPNVLLESMACGIPIITSDCISGPREMLDISYEKEKILEKIEYAKYGILLQVPNNNNINIWSKFIDLLINDELMINNYIKLGYKRIQDFDKNKIISQWKYMKDKYEK